MTTLAVVTAVVLAGCSQPAGSSSSSSLRRLISPAQAASILRRTSLTNNRANSTLDLRLLRSYESGSALAIDGAQYAMVERAKRLGAKPIPSPRFGIRPLQVVVGEGVRYPASFLVVGATELQTAVKGATCPHADTLLQYEKSTPRAPWRIVLEPTANEGRFARVEAEHGTAVPMSPSEASRADAVPQRVATALQDYEVSGRLGLLARADFSGPCWAIPDPRSELRQIEAAGLSGRELYQPATGTTGYLLSSSIRDQAGPTAKPGTAPGGARSAGLLVLFTLDFEDQLFAGAGRAIDWRPRPVADPASVLLRAGRYAGIYEHGELELAARLASDGRISIAGEYGGVTSVTGTPAKASGGGSLVGAYAP